MRLYVAIAQFWVSDSVKVQIRDMAWRKIELNREARRQVIALLGFRCDRPAYTIYVPMDWVLTHGTMRLGF